MESKRLCEVGLLAIGMLVWVARDLQNPPEARADDVTVGTIDSDTDRPKFEADVRSGKAAVQVVRKNDPGHSGGGGALGWPSLLALLMLVTFPRRPRLTGMTQ